MAIAYRQKVELGKRLLPVRLADAPRREDWKGIQEFDFIHKEYAAALTEVLHAVDTSLIAPVIGAPPISPTSNAPERQLSPTERLAQETHTAYGLEHWSDVLDKTQILIERNAMTPVLWRERASAAFAIGDNNGGLKVIKQALQAGVDDSDTLLLYTQLTAKAGDDNQAVDILTRAYALTSFDDTNTRLAILEELTAALARLNREEDVARRVRDARRLAPADPRWALREVKTLLDYARYDEAAAAVRALPAGSAATSALPEWEAAILTAASGSWDGQNWLVYRALLKAAGYAGVDPSAIARWRLKFLHFKPLTMLSDLGDYVPAMRNMAWSPDGTRLAIVGGRCGIWDIGTGHLLVALSEPVATSMKRRFASLLGSYSSRLPLWSSVAWSPDGTRLAAAVEGIGIQALIWDATSGHPLMKLRGSAEGLYPYAAVAWAPDGARLAYAQGNLVEIWDASDGQRLTTLARSLHPGSPLAWSPDGTRLATASTNGAQVIDLVNGHLLATFTGYAEGVNDLVWSPDGTRVAIGSSSGGPIHPVYNAGIWEVRSGQQLISLSGYHGATPGYYDGSRLTAWTPDGTRLIGTSYGHPKMWETTNGQLLNLSINSYSSSSLPHQVQSAAWAIDGTRVAVVGKQNGQYSITIWGEE
jgi:WD40 repeat protein